MPEDSGAVAPITGQSVCAILVLYRRSLDESVAWRSLTGSGMAPGAGDVRFQAIICDNSPEPAPIPPLPAFASFISDPQNRGLAHAYNFALARAAAEHYDWLLTLDQDTALPVDFLDRMLRHARAASPTIAAIVPQLSEGNILLSPRIVRFARTAAIHRGYVGVADGEVHAFNSAALWRVKALKDIGGFCEDFWLDHLDIWTHHQLHRAGYRVFIAGDLQLQHSLSLLDYKTRVTPERYASFLRAEGAYVDLCKPWLERSALNCRLVIRYLRQSIRGEAPEIRRLTLQTARYRLATGRQHRIAQWKHCTVNRPGLSGERRQTVSVCMAVRNGANFIAEQIASILPQLREDDQVVIVDDASCDNTVGIIEQFRDARIRVVHQQQNCGVVRSFGRALQEVRGDIIFLSDHDDLWAPNKVKKFLEVFEAQPNVSLVISDVFIIDAQGRRTAGPRFGSRKFHVGILANLIRNRYQGSAMAFRRSILDYCLPFPGDIPIHDVWIGLVNQFVGEAAFIPEPLLLYRRHGKNDSPDRHAPIPQMVRWRWALLRNLFRLYLRRIAFRQR